jgi:O-antigen/teichoic acid export membrane protein
MGAWSLVAGQLAGVVTQTALLWVYTPFVPSPRSASRKMLREMLRYGRFVSGANVVIFVNDSLDKIAVGRFLGAAPLGAYSVAWRLAGLPSTLIGMIVGRVMFSVFARLQHDLDAVRVAYVQNLQRTLLFALPITVALAICAEPVVLGLLGPKWTGAIDPLRILAVYGLIRLTVAPSGELFKGIGRPQLALASATLYFFVVLPALLLLVPPYGTSGAAWALVVAEGVVGVVVLRMTFTSIMLRPWELTRALARPLACAAVVGAVLAVVAPLSETFSPVVSLFVVAVAGTGAYLAAIALFARPILAPITAGFRRV